MVYDILFFIMIIFKRIVNYRYQMCLLILSHCVNFEKKTLNTYTDHIHYTKEKNEWYT